ncbi:MAG: hypothetical protein AAFS01_05425 [Pseudomonadota bacterium]
MTFVKLTNSISFKEVFVQASEILSIEGGESGSHLKLKAPSESGFTRMLVREDPSEVMARVANPKASHDLPLTERPPARVEIGKRTDPESRRLQQAAALRVRGR